MNNKHVVPGSYQQPIYSKIATHPGEVLKDEIEERKLVKTEVAQTLSIQPGHLSELFKGKRIISPAFALKLQELLNIPTETWLILQNRYNLTELRLLETA
ncbi:MAG TPA: HigA family addiction module antitoxin [Parafilimonas sp.]|nr:HigA family addiction module antitoxin [Parafilimonas sp.]